MYSRDSQAKREPLNHPSDEGLLEAVYDCIRNNTPIDSIHIPHSDVFYVREALEYRFNCELSLAEVEHYMRTEMNWEDTNRGDN